mmetsp:Transcript_9499/g.25329  ORF Transcript_9499/g.25329 Transcript_9499/m.25329 type:complete len:618 (+) Transcript_9499:262-2115(+)
MDPESDAGAHETNGEADAGDVRTAASDESGAAQNAPRDTSKSPKGQKKLIGVTSSLSLYRRFDDRPSAPVVEDESSNTPAAARDLSDGDTSSSDDEGMPVLIAPTGTSIRAERGSLLRRAPVPQGADTDSTGSTSSATPADVQKVAVPAKEPGNETNGGAIGEGAPAPAPAPASTAHPIVPAEKSPKDEGRAAPNATAANASAPVTATSAKATSVAAASSVSPQKVPTIRPPQVPPKSTARSVLDTSKLATSATPAAAPKPAPTSGSAHVVPTVSTAARQSRQTSSISATSGAGSASSHRAAIKLGASHSAAGAVGGPRAHSSAAAGPRPNPTIRPPQNRGPPVKIRPPQVRGPPPGNNQTSKPSMAAALVSQAEGGDSSKGDKDMLNSSLEQLALELQLDDPDGNGLSHQKSDPGKADGAGKRNTFQGFSSLKPQGLSKQTSSSKASVAASEITANGQKSKPLLDMMEVQRLIYETELIQQSHQAAIRMPNSRATAPQAPVSARANGPSSFAPIDDNTLNERRTSEPELSPANRRGGNEAKIRATAPLREFVDEERALDARSVSLNARNRGSAPSTPRRVERARTETRTDNMDGGVLDSISMKFRQKGFRKVQRRY